MKKDGLRVGINLMPIQIKEAPDIYRSMTRLLEELLPLSGDIQYFCYVSSATNELIGSAYPNVQKIVCSQSNEIEHRATAGEVDVVICAAIDSNVDAVAYPIVMLLTELAHLANPGAYTTREIEMRRRLREWPARFAQKVIVTSEEDKSSLIEHAGVAADRILLIRAPAGKNTVKPVSAGTKFIAKTPEKETLPEDQPGTNPGEIQLLVAELYKAAEEYRNPKIWYREKENVPAPAPLVSIITPSYQQMEYIEETINSVLSQSYSNIELIVVDGGSTDGTVEILKKYADRIRWVSEPDEGQADAVNKGLSLAKGEVVGWLNSDDTYLPGAVEKAVAALSKKSGCWLVYGEAYYTDAEGRVLERYPTETYSIENLLRYCIICQPTVFFNRRLIQQQGSLNKEYHMAMDYELWLRYSKIAPFLYIPEYLATYRLHPQSKTTTSQAASVREARMACRLHYQRTSLSWCFVNATSLTAKVPYLGKTRISRWLISRAILLGTMARDLLPYYAKSMFRKFIGMMGPQRSGI